MLSKLTNAAFALDWGEGEHAVVLTVSGRDRHLSLTVQREDGQLLVQAETDGRTVRLETSSKYQTEVTIRD